MAMNAEEKTAFKSFLVIFEGPFETDIRLYH